MNAPMLQCVACRPGEPCSCGGWAGRPGQPEPRPAVTPAHRTSAFSFFVAYLRANLRALLRAFYHPGAVPVPENDPGARLSRSRRILAGLRGQNEPALFEGQEGFWVQGDCIFIASRHPAAAIAEYRRAFSRGGDIACSHNHHCGSILREKERVERNGDATPAAA